MHPESVMYSMYLVHPSCSEAILRSVLSVFNHDVQGHLASPMNAKLLMYLTYPIYQNPVPPACADTLPQGFVSMPSRDVQERVTLPW